VIEISRHRSRSRPDTYDEAHAHAPASRD